MAGELEDAVVVDFPLCGEWVAFNSPADRVPSHGTDMLGQSPASRRSDPVPRMNRSGHPGVPAAMQRIVVLVAVLGLLTACEIVDPPETGSILIVAMAGPTCPVETDPPDPECAPRPVASAPIVVSPADGRDVVIAQGATDAEGRLTLSVPVGNYLVTGGAVEGLMAAPAPVVVSVLAGVTTEVPLGYDTGIR